MARLMEKEKNGLQREAHRILEQNGLGWSGVWRNKTLTMKLPLRRRDTTIKGGSSDDEGIAVTMDEELRSASLITEVTKTSYPWTLPNVVLSYIILQISRWMLQIIWMLPTAMLLAVSVSIHHTIMRCFFLNCISLNWKFLVYKPQSLYRSIAGFCRQAYSKTYNGILDERYGQMMTCL